MGWQCASACVCLSVCRQPPSLSTDVLAPRGWPLTLAGRVVLHLGQLDPTLLRNRDCYLCVDHRVRVGLVWKWECVIHSRDLEASSLLSPLVLEMAVSEADDLPGLLQALLVSVERAIERVPLDDLSFPCPRCALEDLQDGRCSCPSSTVQKKDTSIQTSPMFEVVGSIPHIDSDEDSGEDCENHKVRVAVHSVTENCVEEQLLLSTSIADIPDRVLTSGVSLPGTRDVQGRPLVLYDVQRASVSHQEIASLLVYYCSLPSPHRLQHGVTILASHCDDPAALDFLDRSLYLASKHVTIGSVLLLSSSPTRWHRSVVTLSRSRIQCQVVSDLRQHVADDQVPGHDQTEWLHFYKELEPFLALCQSCGRRLVGVMSELRTSEGLSRRQLHHQHKALSRALGDAELQRLRRDGPGVVSGLRERARWLPASEDVRLSVERARRLFEEVDRAARRLETLWEGRRERIRELARVRALEDETEQVLSWLCKKGEETLRKHTRLATNLSDIKEQEQDFERFYFISMRHLDKGSDLLEEAGQQNTRSGLRDLARSLKQHLRGFSERLEDTRERLEDTSRCFYLLDKAYEWAMETMKYMSQLKTDDEQTSKQLQQYLMAHPPIAEDHFTEMLQLAHKLGNDKLLEQAKVAQARCQEAMEAIETQQSGEESTTLESRPLSPSAPVGRRRSVGSFPYIYKCSHHAAGHACSCWDPTPSTLDDCTCGRSNNLGDIREVRESAEDLLEGGAGAQRHCQCDSASSDSGTGHCSASEHKCDKSCVKSSEFLEEQDSGGASSKPVAPVSVNSHLHCRASSLDLHSVAPPPGGGSTQLKTHKTVLLIMREMIQTERDYVKSLEYVIENYIPELLREDIPQALRGQRNVIFGNVEKIYEFHSQYFLQELQKCENSPLQVGQCFLRHEKKFYLYALYNKNKPKSDSLMSEYGTAFFKTKQMELGDKMDLASYLLKPVQRMGKYALLLQQLMKAYPDNEVDVSDIKAAETMVRFQLRHGNDLLAMDSLRDCDVNVKEQGRLLRQNEFLVWQGKGKKCLRHVFLFEELILFSKARRFPDRKNLDLYIYKNSIKMTDIGLTARIGDSPTKFEIWFRKRKPNDTFTLQSMSEEIKQAWTEEISKLLWKQALKNREMRLAEMSSMGIGNKPCLDIRPSADQISDRSISIAQLTKTAPRFRNSITVSSSGELLHRSTKRPHSIISVSSSSSSGGSSSGNSGYGALINLGLDTTESPRMHHRSTTLNSQCSTESGIIADISLGSEGDLDGSSSSHWHVERSNSSVTSVSLDSSLSPTSPMSPSEEEKSIVPTGAQDYEEVTVKL